MYIAVCDSHDWEGMRREDHLDAELDLEAHVATYPDEEHDGLRISSLETSTKVDSKNEENGSTHVRCNRQNCRWHRDINSFVLGENGGWVRVKAIWENVFDVSITCNSASGNSYIFSDQGKLIGAGQTMTLPPGEYTITPRLRWVSGPSLPQYNTFTAFVSWFQNG
ncbi:hypothetical protein [Parvularcula oceani]|uniref:hypothetical protein n=1 Tax=Parvularcula oceani TaxID=1247963 RepID=UPI0012DFE542|nr:hypothetical protein [Parvularcula oceani]